MYRAYRFREDGRYHAADYLKDEAAVKRYLKKHGDRFKEVRIVDDLDHIVCQMIDGILVWPEAELSPTASSTTPNSPAT